MKIQVTSSDAPKAIGPYSQAIWAGDILFCSGQLPVNPQSNKIEGTDISEQAVQVFKNIKAVLNAADLDFNHIVKTTIFLQSMEDFKTVNEIYAKYFSMPYPARSCVEVSRLPADAKIEVEVVAKR